MTTFAAPDSPAPLESVRGELRRLLRAFAQTDAARACASPTGAYANCLAVSARYAYWLRDRGVASGLVHCEGSLAPAPAGAGRWPFCDPGTHRHWTVRAEGWSIDWTARQFDGRAAWPRLDRVEALAIRWRVVEEWACDQCTALVADALHMELAPAGLCREHRTVAQATRGRGPFRDPRHDSTPALAKPCRCARADATSYGRA